MLLSRQLQSGKYAMTTSIEKQRIPYLPQSENYWSISYLMPRTTNQSICRAGLWNEEFGLRSDDLSLKETRQSLRKTTLILCSHTTLYINDKSNLRHVGVLPYATHINVRWMLDQRKCNQSWKHQMNYELQTSVLPFKETFLRSKILTNISCWKSSPKLTPTMQIYVFVQLNGS